MNLRSKCIRCGSTTSLNTILPVTIENVKYEVALCDEHAEDTTIKQVKECVIQRLKEIDELLKKANELGIELGDKKLIIIESPKEPEASPQMPPQEPETTPSTSPQTSHKIVKKAPAPKTTIQYKKNNPQPKPISSSMVRGVHGVAQGKVAAANLERRESLSTSSVVEGAIRNAKKRNLIDEDKEVSLPTIRSKEQQVVEGRGRKPMVIPKTIKYSDGVTNIHVVNTGGDKTIQDRFRDLAQDSMQGDRPRFCYGADGYDVIPCNACDGTGTAKVGTGPCPKCQGVGFLNR
jgi:hypothetical protein